MGFQLLTSLGSIHVENNPYIYTYSQYTKDQSQSKHIHKNLNLECYFLGVFFLLASRSCAISQFRPMRDDIHCVDPLTTSNFWMPEMVWRLHIRFFVFPLCSNMFQHVPTCSNMFQHVPTCSIWHLHSHALTLKGFTAAESQAPWGQGNVEPSAESRAPGHNVAEWLPAPVPGHLMWMCSMENPKNHMDNLMIFIDDLMGFWMVLDGFDGIWG